MQPPAVPLRPVLTLHLTERRLLLRAADLGSLLIALYVALTFAHPAQPGIAQADKWPQWLLLLGVIWTVSTSVANSYDLRIAGDLRTSLLTCARAFGATALLYLLIPYVSPPLLSSRLALATWVVLAVALMALLRASYATFLVGPSFERRAIFAGSGRSALDMLTFLGTDAPGYRIVALVTPDAQGLGSTPAAGSYRELTQIARERGVDEVIVADQDADPELARALISLYEAGIAVRRTTDLYEELTGRVPVSHVRADWLDVLPLGAGGGRLYDVISRATDAVLAACALVVLAPFLALVALAILVDSGRPILYRQLRLGRLGRPFEVLKFRTMVHDAEPNGDTWAADADARRTRVGRLLRRLHADELPQLWNVMSGQMSLIGPRPERPGFVSRLEREIPFYRARLLVRPGITGWAQVRARYASSVDASLEKLQYDLYYVKHRSPYLDLVIALKTIGVVLRAAGR